MAKCNETANLRPRYFMTMMNMIYYDGSNGDSENICNGIYHYTGIDPDLCKQESK